MSSLSPKARASSAEGPSWVSPKRRPRPQPLQNAAVEVSRSSGLVASRGTFGGSDRFSAKLYKLPHEVPVACTLGVGERPKVADMISSPPAVGPGSYEIIASAAKAKSPLDGPQFCSISIHRKLPSQLVPANMCSPGPHHKYEVRKPLDAHLPNYGVPFLSRGARHPAVEDTDGPGFNHNDVHDRSVARSSSTPGLSGPDGAALIDVAGGTKRCVKTTFGTADRFRAGRQTSSPVGDLYYAHSKFQNGEDYLSGCRTCSFGMGTKTDFSNPYHGHRLAVSPVSYSPITSVTLKTSALDGFTSRLESPIHAACRSLSSPSRRARHSSSPSVSPVSSPTARSPQRGTRGGPARQGTAAGLAEEASGAAPSSGQTSSPVPPPIVV